MAQMDALSRRCYFAHSKIFVRRRRRSHPRNFSKDCSYLPANGRSHQGVPEALHSMVLPYRMLPILVLLKLQLRDLEDAIHARCKLLRGLARSIVHVREVDQEIGAHRGD